MLEHDLIKRFFTRKASHSNVTVGVGDDAAVLRIPETHELVTSIDTMVSGVNFPINTAAEDIAYKSLAVSLSDMAAMGAKPNTALLALTLPETDGSWLSGFSHGFFECLVAFDVDLIGGDISKGPLSVTTTLNGLVPKGSALLRTGAKPGDAIYVTGSLGDAGLALQQLKAKQTVQDAALRKLNRPTPRIEAGLAIRDFASAAIDISDGLATDLEKLCHASDVGAQVYVSDIPLSDTLTSSVNELTAITLALTAGDDFELCFTASPEHTCDYYKIGHIIEEKGLTFIDKNQQAFELKQKGYEHF